MKLKLLKNGTIFLQLFVTLLIIDILSIILFIIKQQIIWGIAVPLLILSFIIFWIGIILVYISSTQLGIKTRVLGIMLGWVPIANLIMLYKIIKICKNELKVENDLIKRNLLRADEQICKTKYPILLVHGVFFRDSEHLNYWGRIPRELIKNGATIYYGNHNSANSVDASALELEKRIKEIVEQTGCEKVNVIAHSKGGLDTRTAIAKTDAYKYIASLTTINTPHYGCEFADYFLNKIPKETQEVIAKKYNKVAAELGDKDPDFISAVYDLTSTSCKERNKTVIDNPDILYQSVGSILHKAVSGKFPLNFTYNIVKHFDGENDGLVGINSFFWGKKYALLVNNKTNRGISHADVIDLNRENIDGFDVREFYIQLVKNLKEEGF